MIEHILFLPHGMQIIPGVEEDPLAEFSKLDQQMHSLLKHLSDRDEVSQDVVLLTPHGYNLADTMVIYQHKKYQGYIYELRDNSPVYGVPKERLEFEGNLSLTEELIENVDDAALKYEVMTNGYPNYPLMLNWGEVVPLYYYSHYFPSTSYSIMCYPRTRHTDLDAIQQINKFLLKLFQNIDRDIVLLISGDLSHVHEESGPYGVHETAKPFDDMINTWATTQDNSLMERILHLQPDALACGISGLNLIHQIFQRQDFTLQYGFYEVPTYFGMGGYWWNSNNA